MSVILILILASLTMALLFLAGFIWAVRSGQFEDTYTPSMRLLMDEPSTSQPTPKAIQPAPGSSAPLQTQANEPGVAKTSNSMKKNNNLTSNKNLCAAGLSAMILAAGAFHGFCDDATDWQSKAIAPVANPIYFEDPRIYSEVRPIFMEHFLPNLFHYAGGNAHLGGDVQVYALQARFALSDRLALIATKDGYINMDPNHTLKHESGWADIAAGLKYAVIDDRKNQFILTPGFTFTIPLGCNNVLQGNGSGEWNVFVSAEKGWDNFHVTGNLGFRVPDDFANQTAQMHYSLQLDYYLCKYFIPFFTMNGYTILTDGNNKLLGAVPLDTEMYDLINFGSTRAAGSTQLTIGGGFRSKILKNADLGVAYEAGVVSPVGIFEGRVTADVSIHW